MMVADGDCDDDDDGANGDGGCDDGDDGGCDEERVGHLGRCKSKHSCATTVTVQLKSNAELMSQFKQNAAEEEESDEHCIIPIVTNPGLFCIINDDHFVFILAC